MKKKLSVLLVCMLALGHTACIETQGSKSSSYYVAATDTSSSIPAISSRDEEAEDIPFIHQELLSLLGIKNSKLKELYTGECYAYEGSLNFPALAYQNPYIEFVFAMPKGGIYAAYETPPAASEGNGWISRKKYLNNPFVDELEVMQIQMWAEFNPETEEIDNQKGLYQLFNTKEPITYELLSAQLGLSPRMTVNESLFYSPIQEYPNNPEAGSVRIMRERYCALYDLEGVRLHIDYIKEGESHIAYFVELGQVDLTNRL